MNRALVWLGGIAASLHERGFRGAGGALLGLAFRIAPADAMLLRELVAVAIRLREPGHLARALRRLLAVEPGDFHHAEMLAGLALAGGGLDEAQALLAPRQAGGATSVQRVRLLHEALIDPERALRHEAYVAELRNVQVETADWSILDASRVYNVEAHHRALAKSPFVRGRASPDGKSYLFTLPDVEREIAEPCVHLGGDHNYSHWVTRNLIKLALLENTPHEALPLLVNDDLLPHQREYLDLLEISEDRLIRLHRPAVYTCRRLVVPTSIVNHVRMPLGVQWLRRRLAAWMSGHGCGERIFVSREGVSVRRLLNEDAVMSTLAPLGFEKVLTGRMSVREQIACFARARVIVAVHGAALANLVFATPGTPVLEINSRLKSDIPDFPFLSRINGLRHETVLSDDYDFGRGEPYLPDTDFRAEVSEVIAALKRLAPEVWKKAA